MNNYAYWLSCWLSLFPLLAARLVEERVSEAVDASRALLAPPQLRLPNELESTLKAARAAWDKGDRQLARAKLAGGSRAGAGVAISLSVIGAAPSQCAPSRQGPPDSRARKFGRRLMWHKCAMRSLPELAGKALQEVIVLVKRAGAWRRWDSIRGPCVHLGLTGG